LICMDDGKPDATYCMRFSLTCQEKAGIKPDGATLYLRRKADCDKIIGIFRRSAGKVRIQTD